MKPGDRVELVRCTDPHTRLKPGEQGTVEMIDAVGTIHIKWDSGSRLGMVADAGDRVRTLDTQPEH